MASKIQIVSNAFILLGGKTIASFEEESAEAEIAASLYETTLLSMLTTHRWRFNVKKAQLPRLSESPLNEFTYAFQLPTDLLYMIKTNTSSDYQIFEDKLYTNPPSIIIDYQYRIDEIKMPPYFIKALEYNLASQFAIPLTGDLDKTSIYNGLYQTALRSAKFNDSTQTPTATFSDNRYIDVRY